MAGSRDIRTLLGIDDDSVNDAGNVAAGPGVTGRGVDGTEFTGPETAVCTVDNTISNVKP